MPIFFVCRLFYSWLYSNCLQVKIHCSTSISFYSSPTQFDYHGFKLSSTFYIFKNFSSTTLPSFNVKVSVLATCSFTNSSQITRVRLLNGLRFLWVYVDRCPTLLYKVFILSSILLAVKAIYRKVVEVKLYM